jgi:uncharacterized lipoprotein
MRFFKRICFSWFIVALTGCSYLQGNHSVVQNRDKDYLKANSIPPLKIPPGFSSSTITAHYPVSDRNYLGSNTPVDLVPPELNTNSK